MFWKAVEYWVCIMSTKNTYLEFPLTHMDIRVEFNSFFSKTKKNVSFPTDTQMLRFHLKKHTLELWRLFYLTGIDRIIFQNSLVNK